MFSRIYYNYYNMDNIKISFIKYNNCSCILFDDLSIYISNKKIVHYKELFQLFILLELTVENTPNILDYRISENNINSMNCGYLDFTQFRSNIELKETNNINKFLSRFNEHMADLVFSPIEMIQIYCNTDEETAIIEKYKYYNKKIMLLMCVNRRLGNDIYDKMKIIC